MRSENCDRILVEGCQYALRLAIKLHYIGIQTMTIPPVTMSKPRSTVGCQGCLNQCFGIIHKSGVIHKFSTNIMVAILLVFKDKVSHPEMDFFRMEYTLRRWEVRTNRRDYATVLFIRSHTL